ncbi:MAG TPA: hypothetical protein VGA71_17710 [Actinomycetota bacterium]
MTERVFVDLTPRRSFVLDHFPDMSAKVLMKQHIARIFFAASAALPLNLLTNWLPVILRRFCHFSLRDGDDLLTLPSVSPAVAAWPARLVPGRKPNVRASSLDHRPAAPAATGERRCPRTIV